jgi:hypothetical protein
MADDLHSSRISVISSVQKAHQQSKKRASYIGTSTEDAKMFESLNSVTWKEGTTCSTCTKPFGKLIGRLQHHCRECGDVFCAECSSYKVVIQGSLKRVSDS